MSSQVMIKLRRSLGDSNESSPTPNGVSSPFSWEWSRRAAGAVSADSH